MIGVQYVAGLGKKPASLGMKLLRDWDDCENGRHEGLFGIEDDFGAGEVFWMEDWMDGCVWVDFGPRGQSLTKDGGLVVVSVVMVMEMMDVSCCFRYGCVGWLGSRLGS